MSKKEINPEQKPKNKLDRRELLTKYGAYTAPIVVSMLLPREAYGHTNMQPYSTSQACADDASGGNMHGIGMNGHCMINGSAGGANTHPVTNPGPVT